ncbi:MAG: hypothetical protein DI533_14825 [Cereibacter sphaeroides]|uniref:Lipoprotein n=1 Tax=Cereibacter sphaeroides TaxID=1063 RepID=A0A2W5S7A5_CERSP|nr:MAG: hypothetical protein DI533_14825 [Cereibacter sphaeroides]
MYRAIAGLTVASALLGCTQPQTLIPVDVAEAQCVRQVLDGGNSNTAVSVGVGTGGGGIGFGGWGWDDGWGWGGSGVAVSTTLPANQRNPEAAYNSCVMRKAGQPPNTPLDKRPEVRG